MKRKELTTQEIFCGMPRLRDFFTEMDRTIRNFAPQEGKSEGIERLKKERQELLKTAKNIDRTDLRILHYINSLNKIYPVDILRALRKLFSAQEELKNVLNGEKLENGDEG